MGVPLTIQKKDYDKIEFLKEHLNLASKVEVIREGLRLLEKELAQRQKVKQWRKAARLVGASGLEVNRAFQTHNRVRLVDK